MSDLTVRLLSNADLDALLALEHKKMGAVAVRNPRDVINPAAASG